METYDREYFQDLIKENLSPKSLKSNTRLCRSRASQIVKVCAPQINASSAIAHCKSLPKMFNIITVNFTIAVREKICRFLESRKTEIMLPKLDDLTSEGPITSATDDSSHNMSIDTTGDSLNMSFGSVDQPVDQTSYMEELERENATLKSSNKNLKSKLRIANDLIGQLEYQLTKASDDSADIVMPQFDLKKDKGKYINPKVVLLLMKLCSRGISQENCIGAVKDVNDVLQFMGPKQLADCMPARGGSTAKIVHALAYVNSATTHDRLLKWNEWTAMADGTKIGGTNILAVNLHNNASGENLVTHCSQITGGTGKAIANTMMESVEHIAGAGPTERNAFLNKVCSNLSAVQSDGCASQLAGNAEFLSQVTNVVKTTSHLLNGVEMSDDQIHEFERSTIMVYCGLHTIKHCEDSVFSVLSAVTKDIIVGLVTLLGVGGNRMNDPNSCLAEWKSWSGFNIPIERRYREIKNGKPIGRIQISGNCHSRIGVVGSTWRAIVIQYNDVIDFLQQMYPLRHLNLINRLVQNKQIVQCELYAASTATGNFVYPLWRIINAPEIGLQEFLSFLRKSQEMLQKMMDPNQSPIEEIQSVVANPVFPFIPVTESRDAAEQVFTELLNDDSSTHTIVTSSLRAMAELFNDLIIAKYSNLLETENISIVHDRTPRTNSKCESILGLAVNLHRKKGRQLPENRESLVIANANRTMQYLSQKPMAWQLKIVKDAWCKAPQIASDQFEIREEHRMALQEKIQQVL